MPLPLPVDKRRSAFVSVKTTSSPNHLRSKSLLELPQPINLCINDPATASSPIDVSEHSQRLLIQAALRNNSQQQQKLQHQQLQKNEPLMIPATGNLLYNLSDWKSEQCYERLDSCAAHLISLSQRSKDLQQQLEQQHLCSPLSKSPVEEATDALMLLQDTV